MSDLRDRTRQLPAGHLLLDSGWQLAGFGIHRESDPLEESNYSVAMRTLAEAAGAEWNQIGFVGRPWANPTDAHDPDTDPPIAVAEFRHWAVGWVQELMVRTDRPDVIAVAEELYCRVQDYPILSEDDYTEREWAANHPEADDRCYSDDPDCGCGREPV